MQARVFLIIAVFFLILDHARAAEPETNDEINLIQINIEGTRPELTVGTGLGISAEITNLSKRNAIYLTEKDLTLTPAPELISATGELVNWWAYFPDMDRKNYYKADWMEEGRYYAVAELKPGETITAFWWTAATTAAGPKRKPHSAPSVKPLGSYGLRFSQSLSSSFSRLVTTKSLYRQPTGFIRNNQDPRIIITLSRVKCSTPQLPRPSSFLVQR